MTRDTNYHSAFAAIRANMQRMKEIAITRRPVEDERAKEYYSNGPSTLFDIIEARCKSLYNDYETIRLAVVMQLGTYDRQVAAKGLAHSQAWYNLVEEFNNYSSLGALGSKL